MLVANLRVVLVTAVVTMFGMGAELGIAGVLAYGLSEATQSWRLAMLGGVALEPCLCSGTPQPPSARSPIRNRFVPQCRTWDVLHALMRRREPLSRRELHGGAAARLPVSSRAGRRTSIH